MGPLRLLLLRLLANDHEGWPLSPARAVRPVAGTLLAHLAQKQAARATLRNKVTFANLLILELFGCRRWSE